MFNRFGGFYMAVKIVTDSTCYIPEKMLKEYGIDLVSLSVSFDSEIYKESEITNEEFYTLLNKYNVFPKSSQPSVDEVYKAFEKHIKNGDEVVAVFLSSDMSGTYQSALMVKGMILENYPEGKIEVIDSRSNSMQLGYAVLTAARAAADGKSLKEVISLTEKNIKRSKFVFSPDTLEYLKKGGRIGTASALLGSILQIKPVLTVLDGKTTTLDKVRTKKKALKRMIDELIENITEFGVGEVIVHHINCEEEAKKFAAMIEKYVGKAVDICSIGPVIGTHVGPGALGVVYYTQEELNRDKERNK